MCLLFLSNRGSCEKLGPCLYSHMGHRSKLTTGAYKEYLMVGWLTLQPLSLNTSSSETRLLESVFQ